MEDEILEMLVESVIRVGIQRAASWAWDKLKTTPKPTQEPAPKPMQESAPKPAQEPAQEPAPLRGFE